MLNPGTVVLAKIRFLETNESKNRPVLLLWNNNDNWVTAGITSNTSRDGIKLTKKDGVPKESVIRLDYISTILKNNIIKEFFELSKEKKKEVYQEFKKLMGAFEQ